MRAVVFERFGEPGEVLTVRDVPTPEPGPGEVRVRMRASPINPSDLMTVRGKYGRLPTLPATPGFEGVGVIDAVGPGLLAKLRGLRPGRRVAALNGQAQSGNWQEYVVLPARRAVPVPDDLPDEQVASFFVNPATALVMTRDVLRVPRGAWLLQTAAAGALGRMIVRLARHDGYRTINIVRRRSQVQELQALDPAAAVFTTDEDWVDRARLMTGRVGVPAALDAVGGPLTTDVVRCLAPGGKLLVYGTLSFDPVPLDPRQLMVGQTAIQGFWLSEWVKAQNPLTLLRLFRRITRHLRAGTLTTPPGAAFPLDRVRDAVAEAERPGRPGKVLLRLADG